MGKLRGFHDFWPVYLAAHADARCRALHHCASFAGLASLDAALATGNAAWIAVGVVAAYALAWTGHAFMERNTPLTFRYPLWSLIADYRMFLSWLSGHLPQDMQRAGVCSPAVAHSARR